MIHLIALYIIGGILLFFAFIASLRAEVLIAYSDEFALTVRVLGIPIKIVPKKKKKIKISAYSKKNRSKDEAAQKEKAIAHMDKAIKLALADGHYGFLTEYVRHFGGLLEQRISLQDETALVAVNALYNLYSVGWARLSSQVREKVNVATNLDAAEREIAKLCAFGYTNKEISAMLHTSESTISHAITRILNKTGLVNKKEFAYIL